MSEYHTEILNDFLKYSLPKIFSKFIFFLYIFFNDCFKTVTYLRQTNKISQQLLLKVFSPKKF